MLLLDVNVLTALIMAEHVHHQIASDWYLDNSQSGFLLCSITELGVIRIVMNRAIHHNAVSAKTATELISGLERKSEFNFIEYMPPSSNKTVRETINKALGHRQITDAYLIALAKINGAKLATFDKKMVETFDADDLEIIPIN